MPGRHRGHRSLRSEGIPSPGARETSTPESNCPAAVARERAWRVAEIECAIPAMPCSAQRRNFTTGDSEDVVDLHPTDIRMYAFAAGGEVRVVIRARSASAPDSRAADDSCSSDSIELRPSRECPRCLRPPTGYEIDIVRMATSRCRLSRLVGPLQPGPALRATQTLLDLPLLYDRHRPTACCDEDARGRSGPVVLGSSRTRKAPRRPRGRLPVRVIGPAELRRLGVEHATAGDVPFRWLDQWVKCTRSWPTGRIDTCSWPSSWQARRRCLPALNAKPAGCAERRCHRARLASRGATLVVAVRGIELGCDLVGSGPR